MQISELINFIESWAPKQISWNQDNVGLQIGSMDDTIKSILLTLDVTEPALQMAIKNSSNLIISHHPLIFTPIKNLNFSLKRDQLIKNLINNNIILYSAHTNLDFVKEGVSFALAQKLGLKNIGFMENTSQTQYKFVTFVPETHIDAVLKSLSNAGAGIIGEYSQCSFLIDGKGTFQGSDISKPFLGQKGQLEKVHEIRLEMVFEKWKLNSIITALFASHPYEEPAYDIYPLENKNVNFGYGAFGNLSKKLETKEFVKLVKSTLDLPSVKWTNGKSKYIQKVGVCGGGGSDLIKTAISKNCEAFVTSDIKYHTFLDYADDITLIEVDHYYSEAVILEVLKNKLRNFIKSKGKRVPIEIYYPKESRIKVL
jgi:dinuclear metal center YbgI/SA1388 family protein